MTITTPIGLGEPEKLRSIGDVVVESDTNGNATGDIIFQVDGTEVGRFTNAGDLTSIKHFAPIVEILGNRTISTDADQGKVIICNGAVTHTITLSETSVSDGFSCVVSLMNASGDVTITSTQNINGAAPDVTMADIGGTATIIYLNSTHGWIVKGDAS